MMTSMEAATGKFIAHLKVQNERLLEQRDAARQEAKDLADQLEQANLRLALYEGDEDEYAAAVERLWKYHLKAQRA